MSETDKVNQRLAELRDEHAKGLEMLTSLEDQATNLRQTLTRIEGAITVLEELQDLTDSDS